MPLKSVINKDLGFPIYQIKGTEPQGAAPFNLYIYQLPDLVVKSNTTQAEYYIRQQNFGLMKPFYADYYVDHLSVWEVAPAYHVVLKIGVCGTRRGIDKKLIPLVIALAKKYKIAQNQIFYFNLPNELKEKISQRLEKNKIEKIAFDIPEKKQIIDPKITVEVFYNKTWQVPDSTHPFTQIKIKSNIGELTYRTHNANQTWSPWVSNGQCAGLPFGNIDGFQFEFNSKDYILEFSPTLQGRGALQWKSSYLQIPYGIDILNINFRFKKR